MKIYRKFEKDLFNTKPYQHASVPKLCDSKYFFMDPEVRMGAKVVDQVLNGAYIWGVKSFLKKSFTRQQTHVY